MATMTLNMPDKEMAALEEIASADDMSKTAVMRQALRVYQLIHIRRKAGERLFFEGDDRRRKEFFVG